MDAQERAVIDGIFDRLKQAADHAREPKAEAYIAQKITAQPYAPYAMAQAIYVQEQALINLNNELEETRAQLEQARRQPAASGGFLSGLFGGGARPQAQPQSAMGGMANHARQAQMAPQQQSAAGQPAPGPWGGQAAQPQQGGGFLKTAAMTAVGVAGGMVAGNMLMNAFSGSGQGGAKAQAEPAAQPASAEEQAEPEAAYDNASYDSGYDDSADMGGGDDWA
jgi:uncharacterized protein